MKTVGQFDHEDADVLGHRDDHLAHGLRLRGLTVGEFVELGHPIDHGCDLGAEFLGELIQRIGRVLDRVMQQRSGEGDRQHADLGQDRGHRHRVGDVVITGFPGLATMSLLGDLVRPDHQVDIGLRVVGLQCPDHRTQDTWVARVVLCLAARKLSGRCLADGANRRKKP